MGMLMGGASPWLRGVFGSGSRQSWAPTPGATGSELWGLLFDGRRFLARAPVFPFGGIGGLGGLSGFVDWIVAPDAPAQVSAPMRAEPATVEELGCADPRVAEFWGRFCEVMCWALELDPGAFAAQREALALGQVAHAPASGGTSGSRGRI